MTIASPLVEFRGVEKRYAAGGPAAVADLDLAIERGEFLTLLGPSGSGKTTTLMMLAGFETPSAGAILLGGASLADRPPYRRNMGVVFQNYALFPHMSVAQNVAFPLRVRGIKGSEAAKKVANALALVKLDGLGERRPDALSGGQRHCGRSWCWRQIEGGRISIRRSLAYPR
ncbi:MAG TPA: ATP-binding cassette domain-containing protein, partial [Sphingopyxis sp.]|uniref:ABC transporter ATP-binding protein n=1 Tax=Sphingopyxis sp. TaxID=1908224 RepID=UPI002BF1649A